MVNMQNFCKLSEESKAKLIGNKMVLYAQQFTRQDLEHYCAVADVARKLHKTQKGAKFLRSLLNGRIAMNFFVQPSSRTFLSFNAAEAHLGMRRMSIRDPDISSIAKGETLEDSIRTFLSYVDLVVIRHKEDDSMDKAAWVSMKSHRRLHLGKPMGDIPIPIVSGGAGTMQHPTQALLDIYTMQKSFDKCGGIDGKTIMFVGDLLRGRTVRSLVFLMKEFSNINLIFASPKILRPSIHMEDFLDRHNITYRYVNSVREGVTEADVVYMTRIQDEYGTLFDENNNPIKVSNDFCFKREFIELMPKHARLMHPLPKREEIDSSIDYLNDHRVVYWRQERNGMWMRVAVIAKLFGKDKDILEKK